MLSLETCKRLRDIGFPQLDTQKITRYWGVDSGGRADIFDDGYTRSKADAEKTQDADWACPNSDELIDYILAKYPKKYQTAYMIIESISWSMETRDSLGASNALDEALAELCVNLESQE